MKCARWLRIASEASRVRPPGTMLSQKQIDRGQLFTEKRKQKGVSTDTMSESPPLLKDGAYCTTSGRRNQEGWNIIFDSSISGFLSAGSGRWIVATYPPNAVSRASGRKRGAPRRRVLHGRVAVPLRPKMHAGRSHLLRPPPTDAMVCTPPAAAAGGNRPPFTHFTEMRPWRDFRYKITK